MVTYLLEAIDDCGGHFARQVFEVDGALEVAGSTILVVRTQTVVATALDVQRSQIEAREGNGSGLEQVVGNFSRYELIEAFHGRNEHAPHDLIDGLELHEHLRVEEGLSHEEGLLLGEGCIHAREEGSHQTVPEPICCRRELVEDASITVGVVTFEIAFGQQVQTVQVDCVPSVEQESDVNVPRAS